jgi:two-component system cell cycle response regulator
MAPSDPNPLILVVDDDSDSRRLLSRSLEHEGFQVESLSSGEEALAWMDQKTPSLILLDINMTGISGLETLKRMRTRGEYVAVVFISANSRPEDIVAGLDAGADDYVRKPFDINEVLSRVRAKLRVKDLNDELREANRKLRDLVEIDDLTGLFNMRSLYQKLDHELMRGRRTGRSVAVIMMDLDHFKRANDDHDHLFGSYVISEVGGLIRTTIRSVDFAARYGGDEFLVVLTETTPSGSQLFSERLRKLIEEREFNNGVDSMRLTASLGCAVSDPKQAIDARNLVRQADRCLYDAKEQGRNQVKLFDFHSKTS